MALKFHTTMHKQLDYLSEYFSFPHSQRKKKEEIKKEIYEIIPVK